MTPGPETAAARVARLEAEVAALARTVEAFGPVVRQVLEAELRLEAAVRDLEELAAGLNAVEVRLVGRVDACSSSIVDVRGEVRALRDELTRSSEQRADARTKIVLAVIAGSATVLAALAGALATVLSG